MSNGRPRRRLPPPRRPVARRVVTVCRAARASPARAGVDGVVFGQQDAGRAPLLRAPRAADRLPASLRSVHRLADGREDRLAAAPTAAPAWSATRRCRARGTDRVATRDLPTTASRSTVSASAAIGCISCATSRPVIAGIWWSSSTSGNGVPRRLRGVQRARAPRCRPSTTAGTMPQCTSTSWRIRRLVALSSTISTVIPRSSPTSGSGRGRARPPARRKRRDHMEAAAVAGRAVDARCGRPSAPPSWLAMVRPSPVPPNLPRRRRVGLREGLEDRLLLVGRNADAGVGTVKCSVAFGSSRCSTFTHKHDLADLGELDRVAEQVDQHLAQARRVAAERGRHVRRDLVGRARGPSGARAAPAIA